MKQKHIDPEEGVLLSILSALIGAETNDELNQIYWQCQNEFEDNPALFRILADSRRRVCRLRKLKRQSWRNQLN